MTWIRETTTVKQALEVLSETTGILEKFGVDPLAHEMETFGRIAEK